MNSPLPNEIADIMDERFGDDSVAAAVVVGKK